MKKNIIYILTLALLSPALLFAQKKEADKAVFSNTKSPYWEMVQKDIENYNKKQTAEKKFFRVDFSAVNAPKSPKDFTESWHNTPINQGLTGTCWCFSTTSFFESEIYRQTKRQIKLSEMYTVYWEYVEKAKRFVEERGNSNFGEGSESNAVRRIWKKYGVVPEDAYTGMLPGQKHHDHSKMFAEMDSYLQKVKANNDWNEDAVISTIKSIMDHYMGKPPVKVMSEAGELTPLEYFEKVVRLNMDDYVDIISLKESPYYAKMEYDVPDNWWHDSDYYNVPLDVFMSTIKNAAAKGYTMAIGGDVSEPGCSSQNEIAIVPSFDIPSEYIDDNARQMRFSNQTTTDDHGIHIVGMTQKDGKDWYLIKDSGAGSYSSPNPGYVFFREDYVKLKMVDFMVHKDMAKDILQKFTQK
ncbi:MAG TPA: C1 family peptidase [Ignavibacteriales bacterium]|nr:C1 family peptidase [Ignavibacteriales bacterium]